jgi:hypothetical protein
MWNIDIVQEIVKKGIYVSVRGENGKMHLYLTCGNKYHLDIMHGIQYPIYFFFVS